MKALVKYGPGQEHMEIRDVPIPVPKEGEILLKIQAVGICGSDIHAMLDQRKTAMPIILGHEFVGIVEETCGDCGDVKVGDWVTGIPACYNCGTCELCKAGEVTLCPDHESVGVFRNGAMAEYMVMPAAFSFRIPDDAPDKIAYAACEPLTCAVRGVYERIDVKPGDVAVVSGPGTIGLFVAQALKSRGAYVIVSGLPQDRHRLDMALRMGADEAVESFDELMAAINRKSPKGADIVCEASGAAQSLDVCLKVVRIHGTVLEVGLFGGPIQVDFNQLFNKELYVTSTNSTATTTWKLTMDLIEQGKVDMRPVISLKLPLEQWKEGFDATLKKTAYKVLLLP